MRGVHFRDLLAAVLVICLMGWGRLPVTAGAAGRPPGVPLAGASPRIDQILARGSLKVGVLAGPPWLVESTSGGQWSGPSWTLANAFAKALHVRLQLVNVGHETKITSVRTGLIDISITPLSETPERMKVVDFVTYSVDGYCYAALKSNNKVNSLADLNNPNVSIAVIAGGAEAQLVPSKYPKIHMIQVVGQSGQVTAVDQVISGRADVATFDDTQINLLHRTYPQLKFLPGPELSGCIAHPDFFGGIGMAIRKGDPVFLKFLTAIQKQLQPQLDKETAAIIARM